MDRTEMAALSARLLSLALRKPDFEQDRLESKSRIPFIL